jgi:hypothetical protein
MFDDVIDMDYEVCKLIDPYGVLTPKEVLKLIEEKFTSTNTQMPSASQIAAEMDMASTKVHGVVIIDQMVWNASLRQLRHL